MKKIIMILGVAVLSAGLLTAQNSRYEPINGKEAKFEKSFSNKTILETKPDAAQEEYKLVSLNEKAIRQNANNPQKNQLITMDELLQFSGNKVEKSMKVNFDIRKSTNNDVATIILRVLNDQGFQLILDQDHEMYDKFKSGIYSGNYAAMYNDCEYKIPEDAGPDFFNPSVITNGEGYVEIPEGVYDFGVFLPEDGVLYLPLWAETFDPQNNIFDRPVINDYLFLAGYEYILKIEIQSMVEFEVEHDAKLTNITLPPSSEYLTDSEDIIITLLNNGKHDFSNVNLSYKINNGATVTENFTELLTPGSEVIYTFNTKADLSAGGLYKVEAWVDYELDMSPWKDRITGYTKKIAPLALPFMDNFDHPTSMLQWTVIDVDNDSWTWEYSADIKDADGGFGSVKASSPWMWDDPNAGNDYLITDPIIIPEEGTYNISFFTYCNAVFFDEVESLRLLYGTSPNYEEMEVMEVFSLDHWDWKINIKNFEIAAPGNYYFALHYNTVPQVIYGTLYIDKIRIAAGEFVDGPDILFSNILTPFPDCNIINETIGAEVFNNGTTPITEFTLTYQVEEDMPVSQTFYMTIGIRESVTVFFNETYSFQEVGEYVVKFTAETPGELEGYTANNVAETTITVLAPVTMLPFESNFASAIDRTDWHSTEHGGWSVNNAVGYYYYWAVQERVPLVSRCITLEPNMYRFTYHFSAGNDFFGVVTTDDFYVTYGKSGTNPDTWQPVKEYNNCFTDGRIADDFSLNITEAGEYVFAFYPVQLNGTLRVFATSLAMAPDHDIRVNDLVFPLSFTRIMPESHTEGTKTFTAVIENRGKMATENGTVEIVCNGNVVGTQNFNFTNSGQILNVNLPATFNVLPIGPIALTFNISTESGIIKTIETKHAVSDSTFAWDNIDGNFSTGIGINGIPCSFGLIYELQKDDILTSITLGLFEWPEEWPEKNIFELAVYRVNDNLNLENMVFEIEQLRTKGDNAKGITFNVPNINLSKGKYFFEVRQLDEYNIAIAYDETPNGYFYDMTDGFLSKITGFGYIHLRPNFSNPSVGIAPNNPLEHKLVLYPNPANGLLNVKLDGITIDGIKIYNTFGTVVYSSSNINATSSIINTEAFHSGLYLISVQAGSGVVNSKFMVR